MRDDILMIPYVTAESISDHYDKANRRLWVVIILLIIMLVGSNAMWLWYESQWEVIETEVTQESENGTNNFIGNDGDISNGKTDS